MIKQLEGKEFLVLGINPEGVDQQFEEDYGSFIAYFIEERKCRSKKTYITFRKKRVKNSY